MKNRTSTEVLNDDIRSINLWTLISLATILIITVTLLRIYYKNFHSLGWGDTAAFGTFGDYIGGLLNPLVAFLALIALWRTSSVQTKFLHDQLEKEDINAQKIESKETEAIQRELFFRSYDAYLLTLEQMIDFNNNDEYKGKAFVDAKIFGMHTVQRNPHGSGFIESMEFKHENEKYISEFLKNRHIKHSGDFQNAINVTDDFQEKFNSKLGKTLAPYYRMVHSILKNQSTSESQSIKYSNIKFFRAQLTESELIAIGLNILFNEEGRTGLINYVKEFGLMKHLQAENVKKLVLMEFGPDCFGRKASSLLPPLQESQSF